MNRVIELMLRPLLALAFAEDLPKPVGHTGIVGEYRCLSCGCTDSVGCRAGCYWVTPGLCSQCTEKEGAS